MNWIDEVRKVSLVQIISRYFHLIRQSSGRYVMRCPFHQEKTPSCIVDNNRNIFHCFGCKTSGDGIRFVQLVENINFTDACKKIAEWYGIPITHRAIITELAASKLIKDWFVEQLSKNKLALQYLSSRGINSNIIEHFYLGWLPSQAEFLTFCSSVGISINTLESLGIKKNMLFLLENRLIFPIIENRQMIAFGGRIIHENDKRAKYINTAESKFFNKRETLYGFDDILHDQPLFIVEGYLDVCMCFQNKISSVSTLGTAINISHLEKAWSKTNELVIWFDGDFAGQNASLKLAKEAFSVIKSGKSISFIDTPLNEDPSSYLGAGKLLSKLSKQHLIDKIWNTLKPKQQKTPEISVAVYREILNYTNSIQDKDLKSLYINEFKNKWFERKKPISKKLKESEDQNPKLKYELTLISIIFHHPDVLDEVCEYFLSMELSDELHSTREIFLKNISEKNGIIKDDVLECKSKLYDYHELNNLAPFIKSNDLNTIVSGWMEMYLFYMDYIQSEEEK